MSSSGAENMEMTVKNLSLHQKHHPKLNTPTNQQLNLF
jgi:hypothetical protein